MIEQFNSLTRERKLELLYKAEAAIKAIWSAAEAYAPLVVEAENLRESIKTHTADIPSYRAATRFFLIVAAVLAVIHTILPGYALKIFVVIFLLAPSLLGAVICQFLKPTRKSIDAQKEELRLLETQIAAEEKKIEAVKQEYADGHSLQYALFPEYKSPEELRLLISFFENGRADTLKEAKNLLEQVRQQKRMETLSREQIAASNAARRAAERAESAANAASTAASNAATQARWAAYEAKKD